jgi:hypothetical protein
MRTNLNFPEANGTRLDCHMKRLQNNLYAQGAARRPGKIKKENKSCKPQAASWLDNESRIM